MPAKATPVLALLCAIFAGAAASHALEAIRPLLVAAFIFMLLAFASAEHTRRLDKP